MKLSGALPKGQANGLALLDHIVNQDPETRHVVIAILSPRKLVTDVDSGDIEALLSIDRVERILPGDAEQAEKMLRRSLEKRSGMTVLPIEIADDIAEAFRDALMSAEQPGEGENPQGVVDVDSDDDDGDAA